MDHPEPPNPAPANSEPQPPAAPPAARKADAEQLAQRLRAEVRKRRPPLLGWLALLVLLAAVPLGLLLWWVWPRPAAARLVVIAFDQLTEHVSGRKEIVAQLVPAEAGDDPTRLDRYEVFFQERTPVLLPNNAVRTYRAVSDADGRAESPRETSTPDGLVYVIARHAIPRPRHSSEDTARLFLKPKGTRCFVVEVAALTADPKPKWGGVPANQIKLREGAAQALSKVTKEGCQVVYLALDLERPADYRAVRGWLQAQAGGAHTALPNGPVLCRFLYGAKASPEQARKQFLQELESIALEQPQRTFVTVDPNTAVQYVRFGRTYLLTEREQLPGGVTRLREWKEVE
jgi:hypothetical protein